MLNEFHPEGFTPDESEKIVSGLKFFGEDESRISDVCICEDGSVWLGLTMICEPTNRGV